MTAYIRAYEVGVKLAQLEFRNKLAKPTKKELLDFEASQDETHVKPKAVRAGIAKLREPELPKREPTPSELGAFESNQRNLKRDPKWEDLNQPKRILDYDTRKPGPQRLRKNWEKKTKPTLVRYKHKNKSYPYSKNPEWRAEIPKPNLMAGVRADSRLGERQHSRFAEHYFRDRSKEMGKDRENAGAPLAKERWDLMLESAALAERLKNITSKDRENWRY